jgi:dihydroneopterin aldolase
MGGVPDRIRLTGLQVSARHGVLAQEKRDGQLFVIDLTCQLAPRPDLDDLSTTVDYAELAERVSALAAQGSLDLIETLAERIAAACLTDTRVAEVEVTVHKPQAPIPVPFTDVAVTITRRRQA